mgnify:CR=1 FL=1
MKNRQTGDLLNRLNNIKKLSELNGYIDNVKQDGSDNKVSEYILEVCASKDLTKSEIINNANIYRTYGYEILSGKKMPSRDKLLQICIANGFDLEQTNRALTLGKLGILYAKDPRDSIIIYAINNGLDLISTNIILDEYSLQILT